MEIKWFRLRKLVNKRYLRIITLVSKLNKGVDQKHEKAVSMAKYKAFFLSPFREWIWREKGIEPCGLYCAYLSSNDQRRIIFKKYKTEETKKNISSTRYAINASWWYHWWDFVNVSMDEITKQKSIDKESLNSKKPSFRSNNSNEIQNINKKAYDLNMDEFETMRLDTTCLPTNVPKGFYVYESLMNLKLSVIEEDEVYERPG